MLSPLTTRPNTTAAKNAVAGYRRSVVAHEMTPADLEAFRADKPSAYLVRWTDRGMECEAVFQLEHDAYHWAAHTLTKQGLGGEIIPLYPRT